MKKVFCRRRCSPVRRRVHQRLVTGRLQNRGELDVNYCDENGDLVADLPKDQKKWKNPSTLVWAYTPVEDPPSTRRSSRRSRSTLPPAPAKGRVLPGAEQRCRDRGHAFRPPARGGFLDRSDRVRGERRWRDSVCSEGLREGFSGLQPDHGGQGKQQPDQAHRPQGQEGRAYLAVVELGQHGAARAVPERRHHARERLHGGLFRQT